MSGFEFRETMEGSYHLLTAPDRHRPMSFTIRVRSPRFTRFVRRPEAEIDGEIDAEGFADHRRLIGTLGLDLVRTGTLPYAFRFTGNDDRLYWFEGTKVVDYRAFMHTMTILPGALFSADRREVGRALLRFDARRQFFSFLRSFRIT